MFNAERTRENSRAGVLRGHQGIERFVSLFHRYGLEEILGPLVLIILLLLAMGCATAPHERYREEYDIRIKVVYLDRGSLQAEYQELSMLPAVVGQGEVRAFFNPRTNTLYCRKWDFKYCGHELHHATDGAWHAADR